MRRKVTALLTVALAMVLSVVLAVPASAADFVPTNKSVPVDPRFKYGMDYYYKELFDPNNTTGWKSLNVSETVHPSKNGGSYYLNQVRKTRTPPSGTANKPLTGKIIEPGKTPVRVPSVYKPTAPFVTGTPVTLGWGRILGMAGLGIGGTSEPPANWKELATAQGVASACSADMKAGGCTAADFDKIMAITSCGIAGTCDSIGAKGPGGETKQADWWKDSALPLLEDLWAKLSGQADGDEITPDSHIVLKPRGCTRTANWEPTGTNSGKLHMSGEIVVARPASGTVQAGYWDADCSNLTRISNAPGTFVTVCMDSNGRVSDPVTGAGYGKAGNLNTPGMFDHTTGASLTDMCSKTGTTLWLIQFRNLTTQADYDGSPSRYSVQAYSEWLNPDTEKDHTEDVKITTTVDCKVPTGKTFTYSKTVQKLGAAAEPACPVGSELIRHDVKHSGGKGITLDAGSAVAGSDTKYPACTAGTAGCAVSVHIDGVPCVAGKADCENWPAVAAKTPSRVKCMWGTYAVALADCYSIAEGYKTETGVVFDPASGLWVAVDTNGTPAPLSPAPWHPTNPAPVAGSTPGTAPATPPSSGGSFPTSGTAPSDNCVKPSWSWNPVDWVKSPVVCATQEAFIPKTDITARLETVKSQASTLAPIGWLTAPLPTAPGGASCPNWVVNVGDFSQNVVCESSFTAAILGVRGPLFGIIATAMVWPLIRSLWYSAIPILRVTPSGSK